MHIHNKKKTQIVDRLCREKNKNGKIGEVYAWIWNMLIVLNIILCWFCSTILQQNVSWIEIGRYVLCDTLFKLCWHAASHFFGFLARHFIFVKPVKNRSCPSKWRAWQVLAKTLLQTPLSYISSLYFTHLGEIQHSNWMQRYKVLGLGKTPVIRQK